MVKKQSGSDTLSIVWFFVCFAYSAVLLGTGLNSLAPFAAVLAALTAVIILIRALMRKPAS